MIAIINYGMGNIQSVFNAFQVIGENVTVVNSPGQLHEASAVVLPGVGAFGDGMKSLVEQGFVESLRENVLEKGKPFLGICLGLQLLATAGNEHGHHAGLDWVKGVVDRLSVSPASAGLRVPHIGWNDVRILKKEGLFAGLGEVQTFYFVHSYVLQPEEPQVVSGVCSYGEEFAAGVETKNIYATQFHPEKSHKAGLQILKNFADIVRAVRC